MKRFSTLIPLLTVLGIVLIVNLLASRFWWRADLTEENRYSLSPATKELLQQLDDVLTIRVYVSHGLPSEFNPLLAQLEDTLDELKTVGGKKLQLEFIDPLASQLDEQKAQMLGIPSLQIAVAANNQQSVMKAYLGLALLFAERHEVIPFVNYQSNLEYELAQAILKVSTDQLPRLGWYEGDTHEDLFGGGFDGSKKALSARYELINLPQLTQKELSDLKVLVIASPGEMREQELFELDQFLMHGGHLVVFADRWQVAQGMVLKEKTSPFFEHLLHYGVTLNRGLLLDRSNSPAPFSGGVYTMQLPYPAWLLVRGEGFGKHVMTSDLEALVLPWASSLTLAQSKPGLTGTVLLQSSAEATALRAAEKLPRIDRDAAAEQLAQGAKNTFPLAAELSGVFGSAYGEHGLKKQARGDFLKESSPEAKLVVIGTSRLAQNGFTDLFPYDVTFVENVIDSLSWGDQLNGIRARGVTVRPLALIDPNVASMLKLFNIFFGPVFVVVLASVLWFLRRRKNAQVQREFVAKGSL